MTSLQEHLDNWAGASAGREAIAVTLKTIAGAAAVLAEIVAQGPLAGDLGAILGSSDDGDGRKALDGLANELFLEALQEAPVAAVASEELPEAVVLRPSAPLAVALDPLDGSNNIDANAPMGSVFTLLPSDRADDPTLAFTTQGDRQLAAGFVLYGPHTSLVLTLGRGVQIFTLDRRNHVFRLTHSGVRVPEGRREYAINAANRRHWPLPIRAFVEECVAGADGPRGADYNTRWLGCVVAEAYRILLRGGVYLYPGDARSGYARGRLRLLYEANPIALVFEQAGGLATHGFDRILGLVPQSLHQRVPLIFGSRDKVERVTALSAAGIPAAGQRPLFASRGFFSS
ncbi:MAG TPA: class 1 fructose-bisphosphatase [Crenalkalicoccus sp.]|nr:class 1 fructose-bisphosphatase [Crenalkalicoccus sp.]